MGSPRLGKKVEEEVKARQLREESVAEAVSVPLFVKPEIAAESLMRYLPQDVQENMKEASSNMLVPLWQLLLGYTMRCAERFELFSPHLLSSWERGGIPNEARPCVKCGLNFTSRFADAAYCCNPCACGKGVHADSCVTKSQEKAAV